MILAQSKVNKKAIINKAMPLSKEEITELKNQLRAQVDKLPGEQKASALRQIEEMSDEAIESMLEQQKSKGPQQAIFRSIVSGEIPSRIIDQNKEAIAVLDIKPISKGHMIIIPKKPIAEAKALPSSVFSLAKKMSKHLNKKLKAKSSEIQTQFSFGEIIINVIPIYDKSLSINSPRMDAKEEELDEIYKEIRIVKKPKVIKIKTHSKKTSNIIRLNRRIP